MGGKQCEHGITPVTDCYVCVSAPTSALVVPRDFEAWLRTVLPDSVRRRCSIYELRQVWEERNVAIAAGRRAERERIARLIEFQGKGTETTAWGACCEDLARKTRALEEE